MDLDKTEKLEPGSGPGGVEETLLVPGRLGRYLITRSIGRGAHGKVFLGIDEHLHREVAVKIPVTRGDVAERLCDLFFQEARNLAKLDHPNIVPVYDAGRTDRGLCYVVSKYVDGDDLSVKIRQGRFSFARSTEVVAAVAEALDYAHRRGLVHRDVKPSNILLTRSEVPLLADFGLAISLDQPTEGTRITGTPPYMSPEQAKGAGAKLDGRTDVFSLGTVSYELLTGRRPFEAEAVDELILAIVFHDPVSPRRVDERVPPELESICLRALAKNPADRYPTARDMADELRSFLDTADRSSLAVAYPRSRRGPSLAGPSTDVGATVRQARDGRRGGTQS
jgi:serine/threonine protein kinase